jgi:uncharacterized membrane protein YidH (DUF202 family)
VSGCLWAGSLIACTHPAAQTMAALHELAFGPDRAALVVAEGLPDSDSKRPGFCGRGWSRGAAGRSNVPEGAAPIGIGRARAQHHRSVRALRRPCLSARAGGSITVVAERTREPADADTAFNVWMAAERTWLAWWRTALVATAGALGVGRLAPRLLHAAPAVYIVLGCGYALLAVGLLVVGSRRHRALGRAIERGEPAPLAATTVTLFTVGGVVLAMVTTVVVVAQI